MYSPDPELWDGVEIDRWWMDTGVEKYDSQKSWNVIGLTSTMAKAEGKTFDVDGVTYVGKEGLLKLMTQDGFIKIADEADFEDGELNEREFLSLDNGNYELDLGTFRYRLSKVIAEMNKVLDDGPHKAKREYRADADRICIGVLKAVAQIRWGVTIDDQQAELMLYDEKAKYLLSSNCKVWAAADVQAFCTDYADIIKAKMNIDIPALDAEEEDFNLD